MTSTADVDGVHIETADLDKSVLRCRETGHKNPGGNALFSRSNQKGDAMFGSKKKETGHGIVALFNASDDTVDMIQNILTEGDDVQTLVWCHFADLKKGIVDFAKYVDKHNPEVVIFDISPPYDENWHFYKTMRDSDGMKGRGSVLTTTNKSRLDEVLGSDSRALEVVGNAEDMKLIRAEIKQQTRHAQEARLTHG